MKIFDDSLQLLERSLAVRGERHTVLAGNVANLDTPGFTPVDIDFEAAMREAHTADGEAVRLTSSASDELAGVVGVDGNSVDLDKTLAAMAENGMQYGAAARAASKKLAMLRYVVNDGMG